ncbi:MAG: hypothetical protein HRU77_01080 [Gammaproteobacteria bacterium]|nr:MAG: hypothetical protein HRU77_01080 [Gammaproteobacteria bacterium]
MRKRRSSQVDVSGYVPGAAALHSRWGSNPAPLLNQAHSREATARPHRERERWDNERTKRQFCRE